MKLPIGGEEGLRSLCSVKAITEDRFFSWIRTTIPRPVGKSCISPKFEVDKLTHNARLPIAGRWDRLAVLERFSGSCLRSYYSWKDHGVGEPCQGEHVDLAAGYVEVKYNHN